MRLPHFLLIPALLISGAVVSMADSGDSEARREEIIGRLRDRLRGGDAEVTDEEIVSLVTAGQRSVTVNAIRNTPTGGTIVEVVEDRTGRLPALSGRLVIDALKLPVGSRWQGIIYPAGVKLRQPGESPLAVFCGSAESAAELLSRYLDIYSEFAEQGGAANASPRAENGSDNAVEGIDFKRGNSVTVYADEDFVIEGFDSVSAQELLREINGDYTIQVFFGKNTDGKTRRMSKLYSVGCSGDMIALTDTETAETEDGILEYTYTLTITAGEKGATVHGSVDVTDQKSDTGNSAALA